MTTLTGEPTMVTIDISKDTARTTPAWLAGIRRAAGERFRELDLPTPRNEAWRFTNLRALRETNFAPAAQHPAALDAAELERFTLTEGVCRVVFVNGRFAPALSTLPDPGGPLSVLPLSEALASHDTLLERHLARYATWEDDAFTALNTASLEDALLVHVAAGTVIDKPVCVLHVTTCPDGPIATHPRTLVVAESSSRVDVIEDYVSLGDDEHLTNAVTEVVVGDDANVHHYLIERESPRAFNVSNLVVHQGRDSHFVSHSVLLGGRIVRNNINPVLAGENAFSVLNGLYVGRDSQHFDNQMRVNHDVPNCESRQYYRGVLGDKSQGVFTGRIVVARDAQKTDAVQSNANLLMSADARANSQPQLEIYADDVKCTHGATIGELDDDAMFYMRARGMSERTARTLLVYAFAEETLERMELPDVRDAVVSMMLERLPDSELIRAAVDQGG